jgi:hypothetical protein
MPDGLALAFVGLLGRGQKDVESRPRAITPTDVPDQGVPQYSASASKAPLLALITRLSVKGLRGFGAMTAPTLSLRGTLSWNLTRSTVVSFREGVFTVGNAGVNEKGVKIAWPC